MCKYTSENHGVAPLSRHLHISSRELALAASIIRDYADAIRRWLRVLAGAPPSPPQSPRSRGLLARNPTGAPRAGGDYCYTPGQLEVV